MSLEQAEAESGSGQFSLLHIMQPLQHELVLRISIQLLTWNEIDESDGTIKPVQLQAGITFIASSLKGLIFNL